MKHQISIHENTGATKTSVPYLGSYITRETIRLAGFVDALAAKCGLPAIQVEAILTGTFDEIAVIEAESLTRVHLDGLVVNGVITGSFATSDAAFNPAKNALQLAFRLDDEVRLALADETPAIVTDAEVTKVRVDNIVDENEERPYNLIHGQHVFRVQGLNLVMSDTGAKVYLMNNIGTTFPCTVVEAVSKQLIRAKSNTLLEAGDYKLVVESRGGDAEGPLQTVYRKVKYLKVTDPVVSVTSVHAEGSTEEGIVDVDKTNVFEGANLQFTTGDTLTYHDADLPETEHPCTVTSSSATQLKFTMSGGIPSGAALTFTLKSHGGAAGSPQQTVMVIAQNAA